MTTALTHPTTGAIALAGQVANGYAANDVFARYSKGKAPNTLDAQRNDLDTFSAFLCEVVREMTPDEGTDEERAAWTAYALAHNCPDADALQNSPTAWAGVTWGLVAAFVEWNLRAGAAISTVNRKLSTIRVYCRLATQAGVIGVQDGQLIRTVTGYAGNAARNVDAKRTVDGTPTRQSTKKAEHVKITLDQAKALKTQPDTEQGRRDAVLMSILLDHGLRVGEVSILPVTAFDVKEGTFNFYRPKVGMWQTHRMTNDTAGAVAAWLHTDAPALGPVLRGSRKSGKLTAGSMSDRAISERVRVLGERVGLAGLSAHDCRHYWATRAAKMGTDTFALRDAGGWKSLEMPSRYVDAGAIANDRVKL